jgi:hypothetical protein
MAKKLVKGTRLTDMVIDEISLVPRGANQRADVVLIKSDDGSNDGTTRKGMPDTSDVHLDTANAPAKKKKKKKKGTSHMPQKLRDVLKALDVEETVIGEIDDADLDTEYAKADDVEAIEAAHAEFKAETMIKIDLLEASVEAAETLAKADVEVDIEEAIAKSDPAIQAILRKQMVDTAAAVAKAEEATTLAKMERTERQTAELTSLAKSDMKNIGDTDSNLGGVLLKLSDALSDDPETFDTVKALFKSASAAIEDSDLLKEAGKDGPGDSTSTALGKLDTAAQALIAKGDGEMTIEEARMAVLEVQPALYDEYRKGE